MKHYQPTYGTIVVLAQDAPDRNLEALLKALESAWGEALHAKFTDGALDRQLVIKLSQAKMPEFKKLLCGIRA